MRRGRARVHRGHRRQGVDESAGTHGAATMRRQQVVAIVLEKLARERYPMVTVRDHTERSMTGPTREAYVAAMCSRIDNDEFPSPDLLNRVSLLLQR